MSTARARASRVTSTPTRGTQLGAAPYDGFGLGFFFASIAGTYHSSFIHCGLEGAPAWRTNVGGNTGDLLGVSHKAGLLHALPSQFNQATVLLPIDVLLARQAQGQTIVATLAHARYCRLDHLDLNRAADLRPRTLDGVSAARAPPDPAQRRRLAHRRAAHRHLRHRPAGGRPDGRAAGHRAHTASVRRDQLGALGRTERARRGGVRPRHLRPRAARRAGRCFPRSRRAALAGDRAHRAPFRRGSTSTASTSRRPHSRWATSSRS